jgi:integrase
LFYWVISFIKIPVDSPVDNVRQWEAMKTQAQWQPQATGGNIIPLAVAPRVERPAPKSSQRFGIQPFINPRTDSKSWRVTGTKRDGSRVRENYSDEMAAQCRQVDLQTEYLSGHAETAIQATKLTPDQCRLAESAFIRLGADLELPLAVEYWLTHGRQSAVKESPRLDDAFAQFSAWLPISGLRDRSCSNLRTRTNMFVNSLSNLRVADVTPDTLDAYLSKRAVSPESKGNDRRAVSRFFAWCMGGEGAEQKRRWTAANPCRREKCKRPKNDEQPAILTLVECDILLRSAEGFEGGRLAPYVAVCLFGGLRPFEAARLTWEAVNLTDGEIQLQGTQTKTGRGRVITICQTLRAWLKAHKDKPFFPSNWRKDFDKIKETAGFGTSDDAHPDLKPWPADGLRHTAISHYFRHTKSYGLAAEQFGNSEAIIKQHYQGRVNSDDTKAFYALLPKKGGRK